MKRLLFLLFILLISTSCEFQPKKGSIKEIDLNGNKVYTYPLGNHRVIGVWTPDRFDVIHDPDCPCMNLEKSSIKYDSLKTKDIHINVNINDKTQK